MRKVLVALAIAASASGVAILLAGEAWPSVTDSGWWCNQSQALAVGSCNETLAGCERIREIMAESHYELDICKPQPRAACFSKRRILADLVENDCAPTITLCESTRASQKENREVDEITSCSALESPGRQEDTHLRRLLYGKIACSIFAVTVSAFAVSALGAWLGRRQR